MNYKNYDHDTPLHILCNDEDCHNTTIEYLLQKGANVNALNVDNDTPLHEACKYNLDIVMCLVENGAIINIANNNEITPL